MSHKIVYFGLAGKAEPVRLAAHLAGVEFEDEKVTFEQWGGGLKAEVAPRQLPILHVGDEKFGQSTAQLRYFGAKGGLYSSDPLEALRIDEFIDYINEVFPILGRSRQLGDEGEAFLRKHIQQGGDLHKWFAFLNQRLEGRTYAVNNRLTIADVALFCYTRFFETGFFKGVDLSGFHNLNAHSKRIGNEPKVKEYYANAEGAWAVFK